jgi:hypothetical protein
MAEVDLEGSFIRSRRSRITAAEMIWIRVRREMMHHTVGIQVEQLSGDGLVSCTEGTSYTALLRPHMGSIRFSTMASNGRPVPMRGSSSAPRKPERRDTNSKSSLRVIGADSPLAKHIKNLEVSLYLHHHITCGIGLTRKLLCGSTTLISKHSLAT